MRALLGRVHLARRETDSAEVAFLEALELEPRLIEGYVELGRLCGSARKYDEALAKLNAGLALNPKNVVTAANNRAWIHSEHGGGSRPRTRRWRWPRWPSRWRAGCISGRWRCCGRARCGCRTTPSCNTTWGWRRPGRATETGPGAEGPGPRGGVAGGVQGQGRGEEGAGRAEVRRGAGRLVAGEIGGVAAAAPTPFPGLDEAHKALAAPRSPACRSHI